MEPARDDREPPGRPLLGIGDLRSQAGSHGAVRRLRSILGTREHCLGAHPVGQPDLESARDLWSHAIAAIRTRRDLRSGPRPHSHFRRELLLYGRRPGAGLRDQLHDRCVDHGKRVRDEVSRSARLPAEYGRSADGHARARLALRGLERRHQHHDQPAHAHRDSRPGDHRDVCRQHHLHPGRDGGGQRNRGEGAQPGQLRPRQHRAAHRDSTTSRAGAATRAARPIRSPS